MAQILDIIGQRVVRLANDQLKWKLKIGSNWNYLRIAMLARLPVYGGSNFTASLKMGLCNGMSGVADASTTGFYGANFSGRTDVSNLWTVFSYQISSHAKAFKREDATNTTGGTSSNYYALPDYAYANPETRVDIIGLDIDKINGQVSPLGRQVAGNDGLGTLGNLKYICESLSPVLSNFSISTPISLALPAADLDTVNIAWNYATIPLDIYAIDVYRFS